MSNHHESDDHEKNNNNYLRETCNCGSNGLNMSSEIIYCKHHPNDSVGSQDFEAQEQSSSLKHCCSVDSGEWSGYAQDIHTNSNNNMTLFCEYEPPSDVPPVGAGDENETSVKPTRKLKHILRKTKNWLDGVPSKHLDKYHDFDAYFSVSSFTLQQVSELKSSSCSHRQLSSSLSLKRSADEELSPLRSSKLSRTSYEDENCLTRIIYPCRSKIQSSFCSNEIHSTKYNIFTFAPKNLYEQFHRIANIYFLMLVIFQFIPPISSYNPLLSAAPLLFILTVTGLKDGVEDWRRHKADKLINASLVNTLEYQSNGVYKKQKAKWKDVKVGNLLYLRSGDSIPADCVAISSSSTIYLDTMSLDGETSLKVKRAVHIPSPNIYKDKELFFQLFIEPPTSHLHSFKGKLFFDYYDDDGDADQGGQRPLTEASLTIDNVLLRGCILKNTDWAIGIVIYTGHETKIMLNSISHSSSSHTPVKRSTIERQLNRQIILNFLLLIILCTICMSAGSFSMTSTKILLETTTLQSAILSFFKSLILFQTVVPIALYITVEVCKTMHSYLIHADKNLKDPVSGKQCNARAWNLSDDLGRVKFVFSDKTGTLTRNVMEFKYLCAGGNVYSFSSEITKDDYDLFHFRHMVLAITLCHSVLPIFDTNSVSFDSSLDTLTLFSNETAGVKNNERLEKAEKMPPFLEYSGESPDEIALVSACAKMGIKFCGISNASKLPVASIAVDANLVDRCNLTDNDAKLVENYEILFTIPFSSERQRMSVVVRQNENIFLLCKGSDSAILSRCLESISDETWFVNSLQQINDWASLGLRILCFAMKSFTNKSNEWNEWLSRYEAIRNSISPNISAMQEALYSELESDLEFLGLTAIEDALQEGVPGTIEALREARICTWVLTGDKAETAINVSTLAGLINSKMRLFELYYSASNQKPKSYHSRSSSISTGVEQEEGSILSCARSECAVRSSLLKIIQNFVDGTPLKSMLDEHESCSHVGWAPDDKSPATPSLYYELMTNMSKSTMSSPFYLFNTPLLKVSTPSSSTKFFRNHTPKSILATHFEGSALIIDGLALKYIFDSTDPSLKALFLTVAIRCSSVICCRVSPLQKAKIVELVKEFVAPAVCLSIGDGANDVSMLRMADVGVGISTGKEGCQAVMAADYSISQFAHLKRLLLVHGRWCYHRISSATLCCFYKNIAFVFVLFWYQFDCGFSSQFIYDYAFLLFYNFLLSVLPVLSVGIFDRDVEDNIAMLFPCMYTGGNHVPKCIQPQPHTHLEISKNELPFDPLFKPASYYSIERFLLVVCEGIWQSLVCYLVPRWIFLGNTLNALLIYSTHVSWMPIPEDRTIVGSTMGFCIIISVNLTILLHHHSWSFVALSSVAISILLLFGIFMTMSSWTTSTLYGTPWILFLQPVFYYCLLCCAILSLSPRIILGYVKSLSCPDSVHLINQVLFSMQRKQPPSATL